ncbi:MAG TPA: hypothetical protein PJ986_09135 [Gammaproteobacteria bacterium]|nr:hypothetical protein [Gammaproteobacteria bacterium]
MIIANDIAAQAAVRVLALLVQRTEEHSAMKICRISTSTILLALPLAVSASELKAAFVDPAWNGAIVPDGYQCQKFGGTHGSPALQVSGVPERANALILEFSDRSYAPMDHGGHGKIGYAIEAGSTSAQVPSVPPHTTELPTGFWIVAEHGAPKWDKPGAYLPPCSGGRGNAYYVTVKAVVRDGDNIEELAETSLEMGKY